MIIHNSVVRIAFSLVVSLVFQNTTFAQRWEIGAGAGVTHYKGDIMPTFKPFTARPGGSVFVRMNWTRSISLKAQGMVGLLAGKDDAIKSDPLHQARGQSFSATMLEGIGQIEYNFLNFRTTSSRIVNNWTPYVFGGYGGTNISTRAKLASINNPLYLTRSSPNFVALGIGIKKEWRNQWNWGIEFGTRWTNNDLIDAVGYERDGDIGQQTTTTSNPATVPVFPYLFQKFQTPGTKSKDMYYYTSFSVSYLFYKVHCPTRR